MQVKQNGLEITITHFVDQKYFASAVVSKFCEQCAGVVQSNLDNTYIIQIPMYWATTSIVNGWFEKAKSAVSDKWDDFQVEFLLEDKKRLGNHVWFDHNEAADSFTKWRTLGKSTEIAYRFAEADVWKMRTLSSQDLAA